MSYRRLASIFITTEQVTCRCLPTLVGDFLQPNARLPDFTRPKAGHKGLLQMIKFIALLILLGENLLRCAEITGESREDKT